MGPRKDLQEGQKEEKQVDKTWREEADKRNRLSKKGLRIRKKKQLEAQALAAAIAWGLPV